MSDMQKFHKVLFSGSKDPGAYLKALKAVTRTDPEQLKAVADDLGWQLWSAQPAAAPEA